MLPVNDYSEYLNHKDHLLFSDVTVQGPFSGDTRSPHFCFRVGDKIDQAVVRHLQPSSETGSCNLSIADLASITVQFFYLTNFSFQKQFLGEVNFQALVSLSSLLFLRLAQPRKVRAQLVFEAKGAKYGVASAVILDFFHLVSDDFRVGKLNESNFVFKLLQPDDCLVLPLRQTVTKISVSRLTDFGANTIIHALSLEIMEAGNETFLRIKISSP